MRGKKYSDAFARFQNLITLDKFCRTNLLTYDGSTASIREGCCQQISWTSNMFEIKSTSLRGTLYQDMYQHYTDSPWLPIPNKVRWYSHLNCEDTLLILIILKFRLLEKFLNGRWVVFIYFLIVTDTFSLAAI